ncbi:hypothetical protein HDU67_003813 [Dinochytrium kinnereticum]|nr:hypothetical protein HDU67_003813 [Dinochytrium kinnereticum]
MTLAKDLAALKKTQQGQIAKLSFRAEGDIEIMGELRSFMKEKAKIEEEYGKALEKLSRTYLAKKFKKGPSLPKEALKSSGLKREFSASGSISSDGALAYSMEDGSPVRDVYHVYLEIIKSTERLGRARIIIAEKIVSNITEVLKDYGKEKGVVSKKLIEYMGKYQQDMHVAYDDVDKAKSLYEKLAKDTDYAQRKYNDTSAKPNSGLNALRNIMTRTDSDERLEKLRGKWKESSTRLSEVRNDYILALESANAQQDLYYSKYLPDFFKKLDGTFHPTYRSVVDFFIDLERSFTSILTEEVESLQKSSLKVDANGDLKPFLDYHSTLFNTPSILSFDPSSGDDITAIIVDETTKERLGQRLTMLNLEEKESRDTMEKKDREFRNFIVLAETYKESPHFGAGPNPLEQKLDIEGSMSMLELKRQRLLAQITLLEECGVSPVKLSTAAELSQVKLARNSSDVGRRSISSPSPARFVCIYSYTASDDFEASINEGDEVVMLESEKNGWAKIRVVPSQAEGLVPFDYLEPLKSQDSKSSSTLSLSKDVKTKKKSIYDFNAKDDSELSFKGGDTIEVMEATGAATEEAWWTGYNTRSGKSGSFPLVFTSGWDSEKSSSVESRRASKMTSQSSPRSSVYAKSSGSTLKGQSSSLSRLTSNSSSLTKAKALYQYNATCEGELSLKVGDIITITNKITGSDAWWEGEGPGGKGQFPVNHVEILSGVPEAVSSSFSAKALFDYKAQESGELSFKAGDYLKVLDSSDNDWWSGQFRSNYEEGGENTLDNGDVASEVFLNETPGGTPRKDRDMNMESQYEYGSRVGVWRILRMFEEKNWKFTCYAVGRAVELNPAPIQAMAKAGHEIASHNYRWIDYQHLDEQTEREHVRKAVSVIKNAVGVPPRGWYTGRVSRASRQIAYEEYKKMGMKLLYDSDAYNDDLPYYVRLENGEKHLVIPYTLDANDMKFCVPPGFTSPDGFFNYLKCTFDVLRKEGGKFMNVGLHCRLVGKPGRAHALQQFMDYVSKWPRLMMFGYVRGKSSLCTGMDILGKANPKTPQSH